MTTLPVIKVNTPLVNIEGDEMAAVMWDIIKSELITPFLNINLRDFDLSVENRDRTDDNVTMEAAEEVRACGAGVKCATITPDEARVEEFGLKKMWKSPNGTMRNALGGTIFREPIVCKNVPCLVRAWKKPIVIARHAHADQYKCVNIKVKAGKAELVHTPADGGAAEAHVIADLAGDGVLLGMFNTRESVEDFARLNFRYALESGRNLYFSTKNTILKAYDGFFKDIFQALYDNEFKDAFAAKNIAYEHRLIDDMVAYALKSEGGYVWACKNYDGDVQSDMVAQGFGSLGLMKSALWAQNGEIRLTEAAHGTVTRHYRRHQQGEATSTNSAASIVAWAGALAFIAGKEQNTELARFAASLEQAVPGTIESGKMTKDLALLTGAQEHLNTKEFILAVRDTLVNTLSGAQQAA